MKSFFCFAFLCFLIFGNFLSCKKKLNEDIQECDPLGNYYEDGKHFIRRDVLETDENGIEDTSVLDMRKLLNKSKKENSKCFPKE